jgi:alpha-1,3-rhamnosyl/mannosyltransferase
MNVVVVVEQLRRAIPGGIGTYALGLLQGLAALAALDPLERPDLQLTLHASRSSSTPDPLAVWEHDLALSRLPGPLLTRAWDRGLLQAPAGDVVHATSLAFPPTPAEAPLSLLVHDLAWRDVPDAYPPRGRRWHDAAFARALRQAHTLVAPSKVVADHLVRAGADASRVEVIEEGSDHLPPADVDAARTLAERLGAREGFLLTVSTIEPRKNLRRLLDGYEIARSEMAEPWPLVVVGPEGWGDALGGPIPHGVLLARRVDGATLAGLYRLARCLAYVPLAEGFGLPPVEAMRECTPVVASAVPSADGAALTVDPLDPRSIADGLVAASSNDRRRSELVTAGLLRARELTWENAARQHVDLWSSMR